MNPALRQLIRWSVWLVLVICFLLDAELGEAAISGVGDVGFIENGMWVMPAADPSPWLPILGFIILQSILFFAVIRLREPKSAPCPPSPMHTNSASVWRGPQPAATASAGVYWLLGTGYWLLLQ
jgi:hypothetical protein